MTDCINKVDLLLALAELPNEASKKDILRMIYDFPTEAVYTVDDIDRWGGDLASFIMHHYKKQVRYDG